MTDTASAAPSDLDIDATWDALPGIRIHNDANDRGLDTQTMLRRAFARAVLAKWGQPTHSEPVVCGCGDKYPPQGWDAGFIAAIGRCANCQAALDCAQPMPPAVVEPVAWAATSEDGVVEALGMNQSRRFDTPLYLAPQSVAREPQWSPASTPPKESDGEVLVRMADGRCEIAWATYWHGSSNAFAQWTFRDPDEEETPVEWMLIPHGIKGGQHVE